MHVLMCYPIPCAVPIPDLGSVFYVDEKGDEYLCRADDDSAFKSDDPEFKAAAQRARDLRFDKSPVLVKELPENIRWDIDRNLKEKLHEDEFLSLRSARQGAV